MKAMIQFARANKNLLTILLFSTAYIAVVANIQGFKAMLPLVQEEFQISRTQVGFYSSFYFISTVLLSIFSGRIVDYLGTKKGLILGVAVTGLMMFLHSLSPHYTLILILALFTGIALSLITPSVNKGLFEIVEPSKRSTSLGIVYAGGGVGGFLGAVLLPFFGEMLGWRTALIFSSLLAVLVAFVIYKFYRPRVIHANGKTDSPPEITGSLKEDLFFLLRNRYLLSIFSMGIIFGLSISSITGHFAIFLTRDINFSASQAGLGLGLFHIGGVIGQPAWGLFNDKVFKGDRRKGLALLGLLIALQSFFFGLVVSRFDFPPYAILAFSFLLGFCVLGIITLYFTTVSEQVPQSYIGVVTGLALIFPRATTVLAPPLFGLVADLSGTYALSWFLMGTAVLLLTVGFIYFSGKYSNFSSLKSQP